MAVDPVIQELMDLIEPPDNGHQARGTSDFGADRTTGSNPHGGFDINRGRGVQPHGRLMSPVYGRIKKIDPKLGRIVIEERDPVSGDPTGYDVEILHTQTQTVKKDDPVTPTDQIGTQGDIGAGRGEFHAHIQVYRSGDRTPLNPLRHLFEYHHPGESIPPLPQFEPLQVPPREQRGSAPQPGNQRQLAPSGAPTSNDAPAGAMSTRLSPGTPIPGAEGPSVIGGPGPLRPLMPPAPSRSSAPTNPTAPTVDPTLPPLHFAPQTPQRVGPFEAPGLFRSDVFGGPRVAPAADGTGTNQPIPPTPSPGAPGTSAPATSPDASGMASQMGDGNGIGDWWKDVVPAASSDFDPSSLRSLPSPMPGMTPVDPNQPSRAAAVPLGFAGGTPGVFAPTASPAAFEIARPPSTGNPVWDWWNGLVGDVDAISRRNGFGGLNTPVLRGVPAPPTQPVFDSGLPGMLQRAGAFDPLAGGLLGLLHEQMRNHPDEDASA